ncbi:hypothetical protein FRB91_006526 [Serendipita sp. 411]|nr:hypothetical protein FRB91_006526 [Serendipita sp. 411]
MTGKKLAFSFYSLPGDMSLAFLFLLLSRLFNVTLAGIIRDGLVTDVPGWGALVYQAIRWEPLCGTLGGLDPNLVNVGTYCTAAVRAYRNYTTNRIAYFDAGGTLLVNTGIGLGTSLCTCFALADDAGQAADICWYFDPVGQYVRTWNGIPYGSYLPGGSKNLPKCGTVNVAQLQSQWSQTAIIPTFNGSIQTLQTGMTTVLQTITYTQTIIQPQTVVQTTIQTQTVIQPQTVVQTAVQTETVTQLQTVVQEHTVVETQTYAVTPSVVPITVTSSTVFTASNGQVTTWAQAYVTSAAVVPVSTSFSNESKSNQRLALGLVLGLVLPLLVALWCVIMYYRRRPTPAPAPIPPAPPNPTRTPLRP